MDIEKYINIGLSIFTIVLFISVLKLYKKVYKNIDTVRYKNNDSDLKFNDKNLDYRRLAIGEYVRYAMDIEFEKDNIKYYTELRLSKYFKDYRFSNYKAFKLKYFKLEPLYKGDKKGVFVLFKGRKIYDVFPTFGVLSTNNFWDNYTKNKGSLVKNNISSSTLIEVIDENTDLKITGLKEIGDFEIKRDEKFVKEIW